MVRRHGGEVARRRAMQGKVRDARREFIDQRLPSLFEEVGLDRKRTLTMIDHGRAVPVQRRDDGSIDPDIGRPGDGSWQDGEQSELARKVHVGAEKFGQHGGTHVGVEVRGSEASRERPLDLGPQFGFGSFGHEVAPQALDVAPETGIVVDQPGCAATGRDRRPTARVPLARQREMHPEVERGIGRRGIHNLPEPRPRHHDGPAGHEAAGREVQESLVGAVTGPEIIDMRDDHARNCRRFVSFGHDLPENSAAIVTIIEARGLRPGFRTAANDFNPT